VYCAPNAPVRRHHVVDGAFSVRGRDLPHGDDTLYIGISGVADITRNLTKQEMLNPPGTLITHYRRGVCCPVFVLGLNRLQASETCSHHVF